MKKKNSLTPEKLAEFIDNLMQSFDNAYKSRQLGKSETEIFVHFDIVAAGTDGLSKRLTNIHRRCMENAIRAFEKRVPLVLANQKMRIELLSEAYKLFVELEK